MFFFALAIAVASFFEAREKDRTESATLVVTPEKNVYLLICFNLIGECVLWFIVFNFKKFGIIHDIANSI
jgi:hypothetical protein